MKLGTSVRWYIALNPTLQQDVEQGTNGQLQGKRQGFHDQLLKTRGLDVTADCRHAPVVRIYDSIFVATRLCLKHS